MSYDSSLEYDHSFAATYEDPNNIWPAFFEELSPRLPLKCAIDERIATTTLRSFKQLPVVQLKFERFSSDFDNDKNILSLHRQCYLHLMLVTCEDMDTYRNLTKKSISQWLDSVHAKKRQQSIIIIILNPGKPESSKNIKLTLKTPVIEKIKADFQDDGANAVVQLKLRDNSESGANLWNTCIHAMATAVARSFHSRCFGLEDDVRRLDSQRLLPGWKFGEFLIAKEALALSYEAVHLYTEALLQYDELEATLRDCMARGTISCPDSKPIVSNDDVLDSSNLLEFREKPYRAMILHNELSLFEIQKYLIARQCHLLSLSGDINALALRTCQFVNGVSIEKSITSIDTCTKWSFMACLNILKYLAKQLEDLNDDAPSRPLNGKSVRDLCFLALFQLDKLFVIRILNGAEQYVWPLTLNSKIPARKFCISTPHSSGKDNVPDAIEDRSRYLVALDNVESFYQAYLDFIELAMRLVNKSSYCRRFSAFLNNEFSYIRLFYEHSAKIDATLRLGTEVGEFGNWPSIVTAQMETRLRYHFMNGAYAEGVKSTIEIIKYAVENRAEHYTDHLFKRMLEELEKADVSAAELDAGAIFLVDLQNVSLHLQADGLMVLKNIRLEWKYTEEIELDRITVLLRGESANIALHSQHVKLAQGITNFDVNNTVLPIPFEPLIIKELIVFVGKLKGTIYPARPKLVELDCTECEESQVFDVRLTASSPFDVNRPKLLMVVKTPNAKLVLQELVLSSSKIEFPTSTKIELFDHEPSDSDITNCMELDFAGGKFEIPQQYRTRSALYMLIPIKECVLDKSNVVCIFRCYEQLSGHDTLKVFVRKLYTPQYFDSDAAWYPQKSNVLLRLKTQVGHSHHLGFCKTFIISDTETKTENDHFEDVEGDQTYHKTLVFAKKELELLGNTCFPVIFAFLDLNRNKKIFATNKIADEIQKWVVNINPIDSNRTIDSTLSLSPEKCIVRRGKTVLELESSISSSICRSFFCLESQSDRWIVSGTEVRNITSNQKLNIYFKLIALKAGNLCLPTIRFTSQQARPFTISCTFNGSYVHVLHEERPSATIFL